MTIRIRELLKQLSKTFRQNLVKLLPKCIKKCSFGRSSYPTAILKQFPSETKYSLLGLITEELLKLSGKSITSGALRKVTLEIANIDITDKALKSKTTVDFLKRVSCMANMLCVPGKQYNPEISCGDIIGHPDIMVDTVVYEIKTSGQIKEYWMDFMLQLFAYGAISQTTTHLCLVLPLQKTLLFFDMEEWPQREDFKNLLSHCATYICDDGAVDHERYIDMRNTYAIGNHINRLKSWERTTELLNPELPYQIFLGSNISTHFKITDKNVAFMKDYIAKTGTKIFVHAPYLINLCNEPGKDDDYHVLCLQENLLYANTMGMSGVVVHTGKACVGGEAIENMRINIERCLKYASNSCPLLLETPAGQGTETLTTMEEFIEFVCSFKERTPLKVGAPPSVRQNRRLRACVDTCHVFVAGYEKPSEYIQQTIDANILGLVHFNDSMTPCGSCRDRHERIGQGKIGFDELELCAQLAYNRGISLVIE